MKYLFAAIDARQGRQKGGGRATGGRSRFNGNELKKLMVDASEGVDEKSSTQDFMDTLERIVNEIKNTTEHSGAFLQKVKKTEVADYYDVIKRPMDLATLMKRVKSQMYRNKKAFADDLNLIWSNCLLYNSHPSHPLRRSAEILRQKSNQLLEFITDPSLPTRSMYVAAVNAQGGRQKGGTPGMGDDGVDGDAEDGVDALGESDEEEEWIKGRVGRLASVKLMNGVNGISRDTSASPMVSRSQTPAGDGTARRKSGRGPLGRRSTSPSPALELAFEERPAIIRTPQSMLDFTLLDDELARLDANLGWSPHASTSGLLPPSVPLSPPTPPSLPSTSIAATPTADPTPPSPKSAPTPAPSLPPAPTATPEQLHLLSLVQSLNLAITTPLPPTAPPKADEPPDALWWETIAAPSSSTALASGLPACPFVGVRVDEEVAGKVKLVNGVKGRKSGKKGKKLEKQVEEGGLGGRMRKNVDTLKKIRRLHGKLARGSQGADAGPLEAPELDSSDSEAEGAEGAKAKTKLSPFVDSGIPGEAFRSHLAAEAGRESLEHVSSRVLGHAGFDGANATALGVLAHVAAEYIMNLGRTLRFYSDRYGATMSTEQILLHALGENGVPAPSYIESHVSEDIDRYGVKLTELHGKLEKARKDQLEGIDGPVIGDDDVFARDGESLSMGEFSEHLGDDFFGLADLGLDKELGLSALSIPARLFRGDPKGPADVAAVGPAEIDLKYPPPPLFVPLPPSAIDCQIGLLRPFFQIRLKAEVGFVEDSAQAVRPKNLRGKVPPTGRIPFKGKRGKPDEPVGGGGKRKRKKKNDATGESEG